MTGTPVPEDSSYSNPDDGVMPGGDAETPDVGVLALRLADAESRAAAAKDAQLRAIVRKRAEREIANASKYGAEKLLGELIGVADSLDLGLVAAAQPGAQVATLSEGMQLTHKQLLAVLKKQGVEPIDPRGQPFNPELHEAVSMLASADVAPNHVVEVMQKGYRLHERLLRPAMVVVAKAPSA
jgi:molecular chaperone GrpE